MKSDVCQIKMLLVSMDAGDQFAFAEFAVIGNA